MSFSDFLHLASCLQCLLNTWYKVEHGLYVVNKRYFAIWVECLINANQFQLFDGIVQCSHIFWFYYQELFILFYYCSLDCCWERNEAASKYNCGFSLFLLNSVSLCFSIFKAYIQVYTNLGLLCLLGMNWFLSLCNVLLYPWYLSVL